MVIANDGQSISLLFPMSGSGSGALINAEVVANGLQLDGQPTQTREVTFYIPDRLVSVFDRVSISDQRVTVWTEGLNGHDCELELKAAKAAKAARYTYTSKGVIGHLYHVVGDQTDVVSHAGKDCVVEGYVHPAR